MIGLKKIVLYLESKSEVWKRKVEQIWKNLKDYLVLV